MAGIEGVRCEAANRVINIEAVEVPKLRLRNGGNASWAGRHVCVSCATCAQGHPQGEADRPTALSDTLSGRSDASMCKHSERRERGSVARIA